MSQAIQLTDVSRAFGRVWALDSVSLEIEHGTSTALMGPNGAGKTTLLKLCATLLQPSSGRIVVDGLDAASEGAELRSRLAVLGHESRLYGDLTAIENLTFAARLHGMSNPADRVNRAIDQVGLRASAHRPVRTFSRGMQQRCTLARILLQDPRLLLLDEPATGLDLAARATLADIVQNLRAAGTTVLLTTHDIDESLVMCDAAILLSHGQVSWRGPIDAASRKDLQTRLRTLTESST